jgi:hypothetical protein
MKRFVFLLGLLGVVACGNGTRGEPASRPALSSATVVAPRPTIDWPKPASWKSETIPFPLPFAPALPYRGVEELRFAPRFFDPQAETYFSYNFAWLLDDAPDLPSGRLAEELGRYFAGLAHAVDQAHFDEHAHSARLELTRSGHYEGVVQTVDAFGDGRALKLFVEGESQLCGGRRILLLSLSPRPYDHPTWKALQAQRATFKCVPVSQ